MPPLPLILDHTFPKVITNITCNNNQGIVFWLSALEKLHGQQVADTCPRKEVDVWQFWLGSSPALNTFVAGTYAPGSPADLFCIIGLCTYVSRQFTFYIVFLFKRSASFTEFSNALPANLSAFHRQGFRFLQMCRNPFSFFARALARVSFRILLIHKQHSNGESDII